MSPENGQIRKEKTWAIERAQQIKVLAAGTDDLYSALEPKVEGKN